MVGNTIFDKPAEHQITCYKVGSEPGSPATHEHFGQIDLILISQAWVSKLADVYSDRRIPLASHHFAVFAHLELNIAKQPRPQRPARWCLSDLESSDTAEAFRGEFLTYLENSTPETGLDTMNSQIESAFHAAASQTLSTQPIKAHKPWISQTTLELIARRTRARESYQFELEKRIPHDKRLCEDRPQ